MLVPLLCACRVCNSRIFGLLEHGRFGCYRLEIHVPLYISLMWEYACYERLPFPLIQQSFIKHIPL